jgi:FAD:protein FMN transferase
MNRLTRQIVSFGCTFFIAVTALSQADSEDCSLRRFDFEQVEMGVIFRLSVYGSDSDLANKAAEAAYARVRELNGIFSDYEGSSEVRRLCDASGPGRPVKVSRELFTVLEASLRLSAETAGAFDVTVGPLTKLWRRARRREIIPEPQRLAAELNLVGSELVRLDAKNSSVELLREGMRLDFGGIAKGFAADEALRVLRDHGLNRALVDASGDIVAGDPPPDVCFWVVSIEAMRPRSAGQNLPAADNQNSDTAAIPRLKLCNEAVATSGDAYQSVVIDGRRFSHIVDPKTGLGLNQRSSVTIIARSGMMADGLASAVSVLGPDAGIHLLNDSEHCETEGYIMFAKGESAKVRSASTLGLKKFLIAPETDE